MALWDGIKRQLRSVIEWKDPHENELFSKWSENGDEIKNASKLIVGPGQGCVFVYEGKVVAVIEQEGMISLLSDNIPFWTTVKKFMQAFESEHKAGIYFFKRTKILNQKWGTRSPVKYDDPVYKFPVALQAYGNYSIVISDPKLFFTQVVGGADHYLVSDLREVMTDRLVHPLTDYLAEKRLSYAQVDAHREEIAEELAQRLHDDFMRLGFSLTDFRIEGSDFDEQTQKRINAIADVSADVHAAGVADISYKELQQLSAMRDAATNEGGAAGVFMGMGAGVGLSQSMNEPFAKTSGSGVAERLRTLKALYEEALISEAEYSEKKAELLKEL